LTSYCKECNKEYQKLYYRKNKERFYYKNKNRKQKIREYLYSVKENLACSLCGENHIATLEFHHKDPSNKSFNIGISTNRMCAVKTIENEISKCVVLCANCHKKLHWQEKQG